MTFGHHRLHSRHRFTATLRLKSPLRLSSGRASETTDLPLMRDRCDRIYIPGTSLRGALRSEVERTLGAVGAAAGLRSCVLFTEPEGDDACITLSRAKQEKLQELEQEDREVALSFLEAHLCDVCKLFGSPVYGSRLAVADCFPSDPEATEGKTALRDGVGIDRDTGAAKENIKFNFEVLEAGVDFRMEIVVENLGETDRTLIQLVFGLLRAGLTVGGKRAGGCGRLELAGTPTVRGFEAGGDLWEALLAGRDPEADLAWTWPWSTGRQEGGAEC